MKRFGSIFLGLLVQQLVIVPLTMDAKVGSTHICQKGMINFLSPSGISKAIIFCEVVDTPVARNRGLMYRKHLSQDQGMLFVFQATKPVSFYMKNTYIPLDIIFFDEKYNVVKIHKNTTPLSEKILPSGKPARYAVEVNAGFCAKHKIMVGNKITYSFSGKA